MLLILSKDLVFERMVPKYLLSVSALHYFLKLGLHFQSTDTSISIDVLIRKVRLATYPERFTILKVVSVRYSNLAFLFKFKT